MIQVHLIKSYTYSQYTLKLWDKVQQGRDIRSDLGDLTIQKILGYDGSGKEVLDKPVHVGTRYIKVVQQYLPTLVASRRPPGL